MDPRKKFRPSHDRYDVDRGGESSGVNQVNPYEVPSLGGAPIDQQGGDPGEPRPRVRQPNRDRQDARAPDVDAVTEGGDVFAADEGPAGAEVPGAEVPAPDREPAGEPEDRLDPLVRAQE